MFSKEIYLWISLGTQLTNCISNNRLNKKCGSILLSMAIMRDEAEMVRTCSMDEG